ncbi:DnaT-like ssDNA-binding protein [Sphingobium sp. UBA5915]|mgnify:CR=1 FL=1|uniref:DnaT-like ssDNA-binding protein n=1 Tax=Sphingobium sp. UBA5915 TaxID=1947530 RepID=UPI0025FB714B|nr:DnaT-like ssDNA-binding protein [Sphingobium sp. UBA5915]
MAAYGTDQGFTDWLAEQGYSLPPSAPSPAVLRARGSAYVDGYEAFWTGYRTNGVMQELAWPRTGATVNCVQPVPVDAIPPAVVNASYRAGWLDAQTPGILIGSSASLGQRVKRELVEGAVDVEYFDDGKAERSGGPSFIDSQIDGWLSAFICDDSKGMAFMWTLGS